MNWLGLFTLVMLAAQCVGHYRRFQTNEIGNQTWDACILKGA